MKTQHAIVPFAAFLMAAGCLAQDDLNSLRQREWARRTPEVGAVFRIDDLGATSNVVLSVRSLQNQQQTLMAMPLPVDRLGDVVLIPYKPLGQGTDRKFELLVSGAVNTFDGGRLPAVSGRYCRVIVDYVPGSTPAFTGTVTESVDLPDVDPLGIGWAGYGIDDPDRVVLHDGRNRRLLFAAGGLSAGLLPRSAYGEQLDQFPLGWMRRAGINEFDLGHPDGVLRIQHQSDASRYLTVNWSSASGWTATAVDRPAPTAGGRARFNKRFAGAGFSPISLPEVFVPGPAGQIATFTLHDQAGAPIGTSMAAACGQWTQLPAQPMLEQYLGEPVSLRVNGEQRTQKTMRPTARFGRPYSSRPGFELSTAMTSAQYKSDAVSPHGCHVLSSSSAPGETASLFVAYSLWDPADGSTPVMPSGAAGVDVLVPQSILQFSGVELERLNAGFGLDVIAPPAELQGRVLLCQYVLVFQNGAVAVTDVVGTRIAATDDVGEVTEDTLAVVSAEYLAAQTGRFQGTQTSTGAYAVMLANSLASIIQ